MTKYNDLGYRPSHGTIEVRGGQHVWSVSLPVAQARAMENDGVEVSWPYASCPAWVAAVGLAEPWMFIQRLFNSPSRYLF